MSSTDRIRGTVTFQPALEDGEPLLSIRGSIRNLKPGTYRLNIYQFGNLTDRCDNIGGVFDPNPMENFRKAGVLGRFRAGPVCFKYYANCRLQMRIGSQ